MKDKSTETGTKIKGVFSNAFKKTADVSKKLVDGIQKSAKDFAEQSKEKKHEQRIKKYNPLFKERFESKDFKIPNIIHIVDDAERRDIDVCDGAIGWIEKFNDVEVLVLYDEFMNDSGIQFIPYAKCDMIYCVDNFDRSKFISVDAIFERSTNEKIAELEQIAYSLGAKSCAVEIVEFDMQKQTANASGKIKGAKMEMETGNASSSRQSGKNITYFEGNDEVSRPMLKWFAIDDSINNLIEMRCSGKNSVKSKSLEINGSSSATMSQKIASTIDGILNIKAGEMSMERKAIKEHGSKLIFEIEF